MRSNRYGESTEAQVGLIERLVYEANALLTEADRLGIDTTAWRSFTTDSICGWWGEIKNTWTMTRADASHVIDVAKEKIAARRATIEAAKQGAQGQTWEAASARIADLIRRSEVADADALIGWLSRVVPGAIR